MADASDPTTSGQQLVWWGIADDGAIAEVRFPVGCAAQVRSKWPPLGLRRTTEPDPIDAGPVVLTIAVAISGGAMSVFVDGAPSIGGWERVESELALFSAERVAGLVAVHAALIELNGLALMVPGSSGVGKSSLCAAADRAGANVLTDEYTLVDPVNGLSIGWCRPVRVRRPQGGVDLLDITRTSTPLPVGVVALLTHQPGLATSDWSQAPLADAVVGLMANTVCATSRPDDALDAAFAVARRAATVIGVRCEADTAIAELLGLLSSRSVD